MSPVEGRGPTGPTMSDICFGDVCDECCEYNFPDDCPCGEPSFDATEETV